MTCCKWPCWCYCTECCWYQETETSWYLYHQGIYTATRDSNPGSVFTSLGLGIGKFIISGLRQDYAVGRQLLTVHCIMG